MPVINQTLGTRKSCNDQPIYLQYCRSSVSLSRTFCPVTLNLEESMIPTLHTRAANYTQPTPIQTLRL